MVNWGLLGRGAEWEESDNQSEVLTVEWCWSCSLAELNTASASLSINLRSLSRCDCQLSRLCANTAMSWCSVNTHVLRDFCLSSGSRMSACFSVSSLFLSLCVSVFSPCSRSFLWLASFLQVISAVITNLRTVTVKSQWCWFSSSSLDKWPPQDLWPLCSPQMWWLFPHLPPIFSSYPLLHTPYLINSVCTDTHTFAKDFYTSYKPLSLHVIWLTWQGPYQTLAKEQFLCSGVFKSSQLLSRYCWPGTKQYSSVYMNLIFTHIAAMMDDCWMIADFCCIPKKKNCIQICGHQVFDTYSQICYIKLHKLKILHSYRLQSQSW